MKGHTDTQTYRQKPLLLCSIDTYLLQTHSEKGQSSTSKKRDEKKSSQASNFKESEGYHTGSQTSIKRSLSKVRKLQLGLSIHKTTNLFEMKTIINTYYYLYW